jgi:hypothetical protein
MKKISNLLGKGSLFHIGDLECMSHGRQLANFLPEDLPTLWADLPNPVKLFFKISFVAICHQINWDYLQLRIYKKIIIESSDPLETVYSITPRMMSEWLSDYPKPDRVKATERARLLRNVAIVVKNEFHGNLDYFYEAVSGWSLEHDEFERNMNVFEAYKSDPLRKKTNVLSHEIVTEKIYSIKGIKNLKPAIDYHIMRTYLRTGRVVPRDPELFRFFTGAPNPRTYIVSELRKSVSEALVLTAHYAGLNIAQTNFIEWQIGRSICTNQNPACSSDREVLLPESIKLLTIDRCPYIETCVAKNLFKELIELEEPVFTSTHF